MAEPQLSVRSGRARELAYRLAKHERRSIAEVVERALEMYQTQQLGKEPAESFFQRLARDYGTEFDLETVIREERKPNPGIDL